MEENSEVPARGIAFNAMYIYVQSSAVAAFRLSTFFRFVLRTYVQYTYVLIFLVVVRTLTDSLPNFTTKILSHNSLFFTLHKLEETTLHNDESHIIIEEYYDRQTILKLEM